MYRNKKSGALGIIITIIILILVVIFSNNDNNTSFVENFASKLVMPIQNGLTYFIKRIRKYKNRKWNTKRILRINREI